MIMQAIDNAIILSIFNVHMIVRMRMHVNVKCTRHISKRKEIPQFFISQIPLQVKLLVQDQIL